MFTQLFSRAEIPKERLIYDEDFSKKTYFLPRFIPEQVKKQIEDNLDALPEPVGCMVKILWETGMRISELCNLKFDCIRQDATGVTMKLTNTNKPFAHHSRVDRLKLLSIEGLLVFVKVSSGAYWIDIYQIKMKKQIPPITIAKDLAMLIQSQQQYIRDNLGESYEYLFCETKGCGWFMKKYSATNTANKCRPRELNHFIPVPKKMYPNTLRGYLVQFAEEKGIRDASGKIFPLARRGKNLFKSASP